MKYIKIIAVLTLVSLFSAGVLSVADLLSRDKIIANEREAFNQAITAIVPQAKEVEQEGDIYKVFGPSDSLVAYVFLAQGQGYQGPIKVICGASVSLDKLLGIEILESSETPGLGARINEGSFKDQFKGLNLLKSIEYTKTKPRKSSQIQAITGATVSSRSVVAIVNKRVEEIRDIVKEGL